MSRDRIADRILALDCNKFGWGQSDTDLDRMVSRIKKLVSYLYHDFFWEVQLASSWTEKIDLEEMTRMQMYQTAQLIKDRGKDHQ